ncbi:RNA dependent RNA polymerase-domain-containing protein, partial [Flagelloscypha sp. PMI_526]
MTEYGITGTKRSSTSVADALPFPPHDELNIGSRSAMAPSSPSLSKMRYPVLQCTITFKSNDGDKIEEVLVPESRALRLVKDDDTRRFLFVSFEKQSKDTEIEGWLDEYTKSGITVGDARYSFLGSTESSIKSGKVIFFQECLRWTIPALKAQFGNGLHKVFAEHGYGKYAARLGLSFSSTVESFKVSEDEMVKLNDEYADDGTLVTDGCGMIRDSFAKEVIQRHELLEDTTVIQIRLGGIKGVLVRYPDDVFDLKCGQGKKIAYRPSMLKYEFGPSILEIQNISKPPRLARLNEQFIYLLLTLGAKREAFVRLLDARISEIDDILVDRAKALRLVEGELDSEGSAFYQELYEMLLAGFDTQEPYLKVLLQRFQKMSFDALRNKMQLPVPDSAYVYGVVDEMGVLGENEVFINLPSRGGPIIGDLLVARNPAYNPRDLRVVKAVFKEELVHLTNCIVFPAKGSFSLSHQMGTGDLDGDIYFFTRFKPVIPLKPRPPVFQKKSPQTRARTRKIPPKHISTSKLSQVDPEDMREAAIKTFMNLRCGFHLGSLCNQWQQAVGQTPALADDKYCMGMAELIEQALDMTKTGSSSQAIRLQADLLKVGRTPLPSFSNWRDPIEELKERVPTTPSPKQNEFTIHPVLNLRDQCSEEEWNTLLIEAGIVMKNYNSLLRRAIEQDRASKDSDSSTQDKESNHRFVDDLSNMMQSHFASDNLIMDTPNLCLKASAWYCYAYSNKKSSFGWLGRRFLNHLMAIHTTGGKMPISVGATSRNLMPCRESCSISVHQDEASQQQVPPLPDLRQVAQTQMHPLPSPPLSPVLVPCLKSLSEPIDLDDFDDGAMDLDKPGSQCQAPSPKRKIRIPLTPTSSQETLVDPPQPRRTIRNVCRTNRAPIKLATPVEACDPSESAHELDPTALLDDKPLSPVATMFKACPESNGPHIWKCIKANKTWRRYKCKECDLLVEEKRTCSGKPWCTMKTVHPDP